MNGTDAGAVYVYSWRVPQFGMAAVQSVQMVEEACPVAGNVRSGAEWLLDARLVSSDIAPGDFFGNSVKMSGNWAVSGNLAFDRCSGFM